MLAGVMPAHVVYPQIDQQPAGFSRHWINQVLRDDLGFTGAVFSDDLLMAGAGAAGSVAERAAAALDAGCDFALVCNDTAAMDQVLGAVQWKRTAAIRCTTRPTAAARECINDGRAWRIRSLPKCAPGPCSNWLQSPDQATPG